MENQENQKNLNLSHLNENQIALFNYLKESNGGMSDEAILYMVEQNPELKPISSVTHGRAMVNQAVESFKSTDVENPTLSKEDIGLENVDFELETLPIHITEKEQPKKRGRKPKTEK